MFYQQEFNLKKEKLCFLGLVPGPTNRVPIGTLFPGLIPGWKSGNVVLGVKST